MTDIVFDEITSPGMRSRVHVDETEGRIYHEHIGDVGSGFEQNKALLNGHGGWKSDRTGETKSGFMRRVAHIPPLMIIKLRDMGIDIFDNSPEMRRRLNRILNDGEFRFLRTTPGMV